MSFEEAARRIEELEDAITANDEYLQKLQDSHAGLLKALKLVQRRQIMHQPVSDAVDQAIAKAKKLTHQDGGVEP